MSSHSSTTSLYALIGDPVNKSQSHYIHNFAFKKLGLNALYVKMRVTRNELQQTLFFLRKLGFKGISVTMPLKEVVREWIDYPHAEAINTIGITEEGLHGWNTDGPGAMDALEKRGVSQGKRIVLLGAGGAACGIAHEAKKRGALITILNRTLEKAEKLAETVHGEALTLSEFAKVAKRGYDILINCTSMGMGENQCLPVSANDLLKNRLVMDIISYPRMTPLLIAAQQKECEIVQGIEMFIQQAVRQYCYWFDDAIMES